MSSGTTFLGYLCAHSPRILVAHVFLWVGVGLNTLSLVYVDLEPATKAIVFLNYAGLFVFLSGSGAVLLICWRYE